MFTAPGSDGSWEAFNAFMKSDRFPDIVGGYQRKEAFNFFGAQGAFLPLDDLIRQHAPHIQAFLDANPEVTNALRAYDQQLYFIPHFIDGKFGEAYFIRQDWLDKLGLEQPQTVEELHQVLTAFKTRDPNGNGKADEIPYFSPRPEELLRLVTLWDARSSGSDKPYDFYIENGSVMHGFNQDAFRDAIHQLAQWYQEGLLHPVALEGKANLKSRKQLMEENRIGVTHDWFASTAAFNDILKGKIPGFALLPFPPPASLSGRRIEEHRRSPIGPGGWAITYANSHPVETIRYFDFWFTPEGRRLANFGIEGVHYDLIDDQPIFKPDILNADTPVIQQLWAIGAQLPKGSHQDYAYEEQWTNAIARAGIKLYEQGDYLVEPYLGVALREWEQRLYDRYWPTLHDYMAEKAFAWVTGKANVDQDWEQYLQTLEKMGFSRVMQVLNAAYRRQYCPCSASGTVDEVTVPTDFSTIRPESKPRIVDKPLTLDIYFQAGNQQFQNPDWPVEQRAAELTGITLSHVTPRKITDGSTAFENLVRSGNMPDIVGGHLLLNQFNRFGPQGAFLALDDLIEQHAPHLKAFWAANPRLRKLASAQDGKLYHIPFIPDGQSGRGYFVRQDWLDQLGLQQPQTVDELSTVLKAFKTGDPNGNGKADEIPYFARDGSELVRLVTLWDARSSGSDRRADFYLKEGEFVHGFTEEAFRVGIRHLAQWYREGLIDPDLVNQDGSDPDRLLRENRGGVTRGDFVQTASYNDVLQNQFKGFALLPFAPPASVSGRRLEEYRGADLQPAGWAISFTNRYPIETIRYFDFWFSAQGRQLANFGIEGTHYDKHNGQPVLRQDILQGKQPVLTQIQASGAQIPRGFPQDRAAEEQWTNQIARESIRLYQQGGYFAEPHPGVHFDEREQGIYDRYWPAIQTYMLKKVPEWVSGKADVDEEWQDYLAQLQRLGLDKVLEALNDAYRREHCRCHAGKP
ncbi:MAG: extracellular solute-binding protein [Thiolinea sp.]